MTNAEDFFARPGEFYLARVIWRPTVPDDATPGQRLKFGFQFGIKADTQQLAYAREILAQMAGAVRNLDGSVELRLAQQVYEGPFEDGSLYDRAPGNVEAYTRRPEPAPEYVGKHRAPITIDSMLAADPGYRDRMDAQREYERHIAQHIFDDVGDHRRANRSDGFGREADPSTPRPNREYVEHVADPALSNRENYDAAQAFRESNPYNFPVGGGSAVSFGPKIVHYFENMPPDFPGLIRDDRDYSHIQDPNA